MPTYTYLCKQCETEFETIQSITVTPLADCPSCSQPTTTRLITSGNFILKGGSWARDCYQKLSSTIPQGTDDEDDD